MSSWCVGVLCVDWVFVYSLGVYGCPVGLWMLVYSMSVHWVFVFSGCVGVLWVFVYPVSVSVFKWRVGVKWVFVHILGVWGKKCHVCKPVAHVCVCVCVCVGFSVCGLQCLARLVCYANIKVKQTGEAARM